MSQTANSRLIPPFLAMEMFRDAVQLQEAGEDVVHLSLGQPQATMPEQVRDAIANVVKEEPLGYTDARGILPLREALAQHYEATYGIAVSSDQICLTVGSSAAYLVALLSAFEAGDRVAIVAPHYPASVNMMTALGIKPVILQSTLEDNFQPTLAMLKAMEEKPQGIVIASPSNPTGTVIAPEELEAIVHYCDAHDIRVISDEIYHGISYDGLRTASALEFSRNVVVSNSFSKYYIMPGWRLGWCVMPVSMIRQAESLLQNFYISAPAISQYAALEMLKEKPLLDSLVTKYDANRMHLRQGLERAGISQFAPAQGAFYLYANVAELTQDSVAFCQEMLQAAKVCAVPGVDFDRACGAQYVRFSYCCEAQTIEKAIQRLTTWMASRS